MKTSLGAKALLYPAPVLVVGSYDKSGKPNVVTASWAGLCCSEPPCVGVSLRTATYSHANLLARKAFTLSVPSEEHLQAVDYFGLASGRTTNKFGATKLTAAKSKLVDAPYVKEFALVLECKLVLKNDLGLYTQFVGEVIDVKAEERILGRDGAIDIKLLKPLVFSPDTQDYYGIGNSIGKVFSAGKSV